MLLTLLQKGLTSLGSSLGEQAKARLPFACEVVFLADRGFADTQLMGHLRDLGWHWRIRI